MPGVSARNLGEAEQLMARPKPPGGLFINDDITAATGPRLLALQSAGRLLIAIDEEGGRVQRIEKVYGSIPSAASQGPTTSDIERLGVDRGRQLQASGINMDFAPVVDLRRAASESVIGDRAYGDDARTVSERGGAFAAGLRNAGVIPTLKHFPGHGSAGDSHRGSVRSEPFDALRSSDLVPFSELSRAPGVAVMVGHLDVPGLTEPDTPASLSSAAYRLLRSEIGFDGLAVTDDLSGMLAVRNRMAAPEAGTLAVTAGADLALMQTSKYYDATVAAIVSAVEKGRLPESRLDEAVRRIRTVLACG
jgi:beta-N-acetylhexosaminidase